MANDLGGGICGVKKPSAVDDVPEDSSASKVEGAEMSGAEGDMGSGGAVGMQWSSSEDKGSDDADVVDEDVDES